MAIKKKTKFIHTDRYVAEVDIDVQIVDQEWSPCFSLEDSRKLDFGCRSC